MSLATINTVDLFSAHSDFVETHVNSRSVVELREWLPLLAGSIGAISVSNLLKDASAESLDNLPFNARGICRKSNVNPVARSLLAFMRDVSRLHINTHPLEKYYQSIKRLRYVPDDLGFHTIVPVHSDWRDGNAVFYNRNVRGSHTYRVGDESIPMESNQLVVINGSATYIEEHEAYGTLPHSVVAPEGLDEEELQTFFRERFLVFCDGAHDRTAQVAS